MRNKYLLSILIPTFNYAYGLERILKTFTHIKKKSLSKIEFVISDDSSCTSEIKKIHKICNQYKEKFNFNIIYFPGLKNRNPIDNWNELIELSSGKYKQIIHHDEFYKSSHDIEDLVNLLETANYEVFILKIFTIKDNYINNHIHSYFIKIILNISFRFILLENFIGPTACIVFNSRANKRFDNRLKWLVDVDFYHKLLKPNNFLFCKSICLLSESKRASSITSKLAQNHFILKLYELNKLEFRPNLFDFLLFLIWPVVKLYMLFYNFLFRLSMDDNC